MRMQNPMIIAKYRSRHRWVGVFEPFIYSSCVSGQSSEASPHWPPALETRQCNRIDPWSECQDECTFFEMLFSNLINTPFNVVFGLNQGFYPARVRGKNPNFTWWHVISIAFSLSSWRLMICFPFWLSYSFVSTHEKHWVEIFTLYITSFHLISFPHQLNICVIKTHIDMVNSWQNIL